MEKVIALVKNEGWTHVQLDNVTKMQKSWTFEGQEYRVDVFFGTLRSGKFTPVIIMNVHCQGCGTKQVVDDNCDVWKNFMASTTKNEGNEYYGYLKKHGFKTVTLKDKAIKKEIIMTSELKYLKSELDRAIQVLGKWKGELQNLMDICAWLDDGRITDDEANILREYNKIISK